MTFLPGWGFRKSKTVSGTTFGAQTDYTMQLNVFKGAGVDTDTDVYLNDHCNDDFSDIRFTSSDELTLLGYFIESFEAGVSAVVWIKVDTIPASPGSSTIYVYYGKSSASSLSSGDNTYAFYDDFQFDSNTLDTDKWQVLAGNISILSDFGLMQIDPGAMVTTKNAIPLSFEIKYLLEGYDYAQESTVRDIKLTKEIPDGDICRYSFNVGDINTHRNISEGVSATINDEVFGYTSLHIVRHTLNGNWDILVNGSTLEQTEPSLRAPTDTLFVHFTADPAVNSNYIHYLIIRKFASPEPAFGTTGSEEVVISIGTPNCGYAVGGNEGSYYSAATESYDDVTDTWTVKTNLNTARLFPAGFTLNGYGYTAGGNTGVADSAATESYDDVANTWTVKADLNAGRDYLAGFALNGYGYVAGGSTLPVTHVTEKYDDVANTWTAKANLNTEREYLAGFALNGYGYTAGGYVWPDNNVTEKYDDVANTWTVKANLNTGRIGLAGFTLNGYGYTAGGADASAVTEKYDDVANTWTAKADLNAGRGYMAGFALHGYGYTAGGSTDNVVGAVTEKYDDVANTWTAKADLNIGRYGPSGFSIEATSITNIFGRPLSRSIGASISGGIACGRGKKRR